MFAKPKFIEATRDFVCIRISTYENKETEKKVISVLNGRIANTAFAIFDHHGKKLLSSPGRSPYNLANLPARSGAISPVIREMKKLASKYRGRRDTGSPGLSDFNTFRLALNTAASDQRLLIAVTSSNRSFQKKLRQTLAHDDVIGRFHVDLIDPQSDRGWEETLQGKSHSSAALIVRPGQFGLKGKIVETLRPRSSAMQIKQALMAANRKFSALEKRKVFDEHITAGLKHGVTFEEEIPRGSARRRNGDVGKRRRWQRR